MVRRRSIFIASIALGFAVLVALVWVLVAPHPATNTAAQVVASPSASPSAMPTSTPTSTPTPTPTPKPPAAAPPAAPAPPAATCENNVRTCVNIARADHGIGPLASNSTLNAAAQSCAERMAASGEMTHSSGPPAGFSTWGENIAHGYPSGNSVFNAWMGSDGHRANILNPSYSQMGLGYVASGNWWCQQFGA
jgi:uncharacterized protein YkwD